jgi:hypothetical protein
MTFGGATGFLLRGITVLLLSAWAIYDLIPYGKERRWGIVKIGVGILITMFVAGLFIASSRMQALSDLRKQIHLEVSIPDGGDARDSVFAVRNGADATLVDHEITCDLLYLKTNVTLIGNKNWNEDAPPGFMTQGIHFDSTIPADQTRSTQCLLVFQSYPIQCADVRVITVYSLDLWPHAIWRRLRKVSRFYGQRNNNRFNWQQEPVDSRISFCEAAKQP